MAVSILLYLIVIVSVAFVGGVVFKFLRIPPVVGYLVGGLLLGIFLPALNKVEIISFLSELGVVLLLFTLGLEFPLNRFKHIISTSLLGTLAQIILTTLVLGSLLPLFGFELFTSFFMAATFSLSSTAIVLKILTDRGEIDTLPSEIMFTWLVIQDLAVLPMMIFLPAIGKGLRSGSAAVYLSLGTSIFISLFVLAVVVWLARKAVPFLMQQVASLNSRELLLIAVFLSTVISAYISQLLGFSGAIGAFIAGVLIAETQANHAVFSEIRPLKDLFALIFFTTLGIVLPGGFIVEHILSLIGITIIVMVVKFIIVLGITLYQGYHAKTSFLVGTGLIEVGEFAFVLATIGFKDQIISREIYGYILSVALFSILVMPPLYLHTPLLYAKVRDISKKKLKKLYMLFFFQPERGIVQEELPFENHVVLCGYGRVGRYIGRALDMAKIDYIVVEYDHHKASLLRQKHIPVVYGDPADIDILDYAQVDKAKAVVVAIPDTHTQRMIITNSVRLSRDIQILCRTHHEGEQKMLKTLGATAVVQPEFEASISIVNKILPLFGIGDEEREGKITRLKIEHGLG
ncbi:cation:proton antiporter [Candidatus Gottesmanbacteria bacterium]|nr:cation:proton antiporter [Candidatus Gottesmanbacteria bacterium]